MNDFIAFACGLVAGAILHSFFSGPTLDEKTATSLAVAYRVCLQKQISIEECDEVIVPYVLEKIQ